MTHRYLGFCLAIASALPLLTGKAAAQTVDDFFDDQNLREIHLRVNPTDWQTLKDRYLENIWFKADFTWEGIDVPGIGIRSRGSGSRVGFKPNLTLDFGRYTSSQTFLGMKTFIIRNLSQDPSMLHERLTMPLFRRMGLPYERAAHARLFINGEYAGLYLAVEPIDKRFVRTRFGEDAGYLYEFNWTGDNYQFEYLGEDVKNYCPLRFEAKTHEDAPDCEKIIALIRTVNQVSDEEFDAAVSRYIDIGQFVTHLAVEQWVAETDGVVGHTGMTNFYYYRRSHDDKGYFLVWDKDGTYAASDWSVWTNTDVNVLARRALAIPRYRVRFLETLRRAGEIAGGAGGWLDREMERGLAQIRQSAYDDPNRACFVGDKLDRCPISQFEAGVQYLRGFIAHRKAFVDAEIAAAGYSSPGIWLNNEGARNAASGATALTPGSLAALLVDIPALQTGSAQGLPLPSTLGGVRVRVGGIEAPLFRVSATDILMQVPWEVAAGPTLVELFSGNAMSALSVEVRPGSAGVFAAVHPDGRLVSLQAPATRGEMITLYGTGVGMVAEEDQHTGEPASMTHLCPMKDAIAAMLDGAPVPVVWAGLTPGFIGLQQVTIEIPANKSAGDAMLKIGVLGEWGKPYVLPIR